MLNLLFLFELGLDLVIHPYLVCSFSLPLMNGYYLYDIAMEKYEWPF